MRPPIPHVRLKYLIPLALITGLLSLAYVGWTSSARNVNFIIHTAVPKAIFNKIPKYRSDVERGFKDISVKGPVSKDQRLKRQNEIFGNMGKLKRKDFETDYQTRPPRVESSLTIEEEERLRRVFKRHHQMQKEFEKKKLALFNNLAEKRRLSHTFTAYVTTTSAPTARVRDLKAKLHYHVDQGTRLNRPRIQTQKSDRGDLQLKRITVPKPVSLGRNADRTGKDAIKLEYELETRPDSCNGCMDILIPYLINPRHLCSANPHSILALVLIFSEPGHEFVRATIRQTWGSLAENNKGKVRVAFLFGRIEDEIDADVVLRESEQYADILMGNFHDSFRNLTLKTIMGLRWATDNCAHAKYVFKTDDDMWLNLPKFFSVAPDYKFDNVVSGTCYDDAWHPHRDPESKYYVSYQQYPHDDYPLLCTGTAYLMTLQTAGRILHESPNIPFFHLEDVYVALCREKLGYGVLPLPGCVNYKETYDPCTYRYDVIASHWTTPDELREAWSMQCPSTNDPIRLYLQNKLLNAIEH